MSSLFETAELQLKPQYTKLTTDAVSMIQFLKIFLLEVAAFNDAAKQLHGQLLMGLATGQLSSSGLVDCLHRCVLLFEELRMLEIKVTKIAEFTVISCTLSSLWYSR